MYAHFTCCDLLFSNDSSSGAACLSVQGRLSTRSDVWSFGVTVWEMLTAAARRPYDWLSDDQLVQTVRRWHGHDGHMSAADSPPSPGAGDWPRELADLLRQCWSADDAQRPTFADIDVFLAVKSAGFCPPPAAPPHH